jgi:CubicO group peptidase (beta-lactamase class C family)
VFYVGSIAKQFTAMCIAMLAQQGKLSLDDNIRKFVPEIPDHGTPITIRNLIHHTSGLRDFWDLIGQAGRRWDDAYNLKDVLEVVAQQKGLNCNPGEKHLYSNTGYMLLAVIVQRASGQSLREYAEEQIFKPLGMFHTRFHDDHTNILQNRVYGYAPKNGNDFSVHAINNDLVGAGGLWTTVEDLSLWDANFYSARVGGRVLIQQIQTPGTLTDGTKIDYAFGLHIDEYKGLKRIRHGGVFAGYRAEMVRFPEKQFSIAILCNLSSIAPSALANEIADIFLAGQLK